MLPSAEHGSLLIQGLQYAMSYRAIYHFKLTHLHMRSATRELQSDRGSQFYTATNPGKQCLKPSCPTKSSVCFSLRVLTSLAQRVNISLLISIVHDSKKKKSWNSIWHFQAFLPAFPSHVPRFSPRSPWFRMPWPCPSPWHTAVLDLHNAATLELQLGQLAAVVMTMARWFELTNKQ